MKQELDITIFSKRLKEARTEKGLTQKELAALSGVSTVMISSYERTDAEAGKNPSLSVVYSIASALDVSIDWLCGSSDVKELNGDIDYNRLFFEFSVYYFAGSGIVKKRKFYSNNKFKSITILTDDGDGNIIWNIPLINSIETKAVLQDILKIQNVWLSGIATKEMIDVLINNLCAKYKRMDIKNLLAYTIPKAGDENGNDQQA